MTEHDLIDAERLAERMRRNPAPSGWREEINALSDAIERLVAEVHRQRKQVNDAYNNGYQRGVVDGGAYAKGAWE